MFKNFTQKPPGKIYKARQRPRTKKNHVQFTCKCDYKMAAWLEKVPLNRPASRIKKVSVALASGFYSIMETKNLPTCVD